MHQPRAFFGSGNSSRGLLGEEGRGPLEDLDVLTQQAVLPPHLGEFVFLARGNPSSRVPASR